MEFGETRIESEKLKIKSGVKMNQQEKRKAITAWATYYVGIILRINTW